jgi:hypothetical protein
VAYFVCRGKKYREDARTRSWENRRESVPNLASGQVQAGEPSARNRASHVSEMGVIRPDKRNALVSTGRLVGGIVDFDVCYIHGRRHTAMVETRSSFAEDFSITHGGPLHWLLVRLGFAGDTRQLVVGRPSLAILITWLPLFVLSVIAGQAFGHQVKIPFIRDYAVNVRFLIALPILILAEPGIDNRWRILVLEFLRSKLVADADVPLFEALLQKAKRLRDRVLPELLLFVVAFLPSFFVIKTELLMGGISSWHTTGIGAGELSRAGWWFDYVSTPVFRFLLLRWMWRLSLATFLLWRISKIKLRLVATHTDMACWSWLSIPRPESVQPHRLRRRRRDRCSSCERYRLSGSNPLVYEVPDACLWCHGDHHSRLASSRGHASLSLCQKEGIA